LLTLTSFLYGWPFPVGTAGADFRFKVRNFTKPAVAAPPDIFQPVTGVGFQPKVLIFFPMRQTSAGPANSIHVGYGFATGPASQRGVAIAADRWRRKRGSQGQAVALKIHHPHSG
jgi:hypothetical protein